MKSTTFICLVIGLIEAGTLYQWHQAPSPPWRGRGDFTVTLFRGKFYMIGGFSENGLCSDIWEGDGRNWFLVTESAPWGGIAGHTVTLFRDSLWLIGGLIDTARRGDSGINTKIYKSGNGRDWILVTDSTPFRIWLHASAAYRGYLWVFGGSQWWGGIRFTNKVWYSTNGENWNQVSESIPWLGRRDHSVISFRDSLRLIGGYPYCDPKIWSSYDGITWIGKIPSPHYFLCTGHCCNEFLSAVWITGGEYWNEGPTNRVQYSSTIYNDWRCDSAPWPARCDHCSAVRNDTLWIFGGYARDYSFLNDVWYLAEITDIQEEEPDSIIKFPVHSFTIRKISQFVSNEPVVFFDISGRKVILRSGGNYLKPGIYFFQISPRRKLILF